MAGVLLIVSFAIKYGFPIAGIAYAIKYRGCLRSRDNSMDQSGEKMHPEFLVLSIISYLIALFGVINPYIYRVYGDRTYFQCSAFLSMFFISGIIIAAEKLKLKSAWLLTLVILITFFWGTTGLIGELFNIGEKSIVLDTRGSNDIMTMYIYDEEVSSAQWLGGQFSADEDNIYSSNIAASFLCSYGLIPHYRMKSFINSSSTSGYIYVRYMDIMMGITRKYLNVFSGRTKEYDNGKSYIYI